MVQLEIERKFLLLPCSAKKLLCTGNIPYRKETLEQFYVSTDASAYTRYRKIGDKYYQTIKSGEGLVREENECKVAKKKYHYYKAKSSSQIIRKNRYTFSYQNSVYEMDIFKGCLKGLCYLEIEFSDKEKAESYTLPKFFDKILVREVTFDRSFNNSSLSNTKTFPSPKLKHSYLDEKNKLYQVTPFLPTEQAINTMICLLTKEIKGYQKTLMQNPSEVEILHQFRVTMRKLRALLQEFKPFFKPEWLNMHKTLLAELMEHTNAKRDNDVALIDIDTFKEQLSSKSKKSLNTLQDSLRTKEKRLKSELQIFMKSKILSKELMSLSTLTKTKYVYQDTARQPLVLIAINVIDRRIKTILLRGKHLKKGSDKKAYHKLRIQFKKLRYLLELLSPIIKKKRLAHALEDLKNIQTILGDINDIQVQKSELEAFDKKVKSKEENALKHLDKKIQVKEKKSMKAFKKAFSVFKKEKLLYKTLLYV